jgi:hypothetical protein
MAKQSQQLVLMLVIGILIGTAGVMAWKTRTTSTESEMPVTTESNATTSSDTLVEAGKTGTVAHASMLPLAPSIPMNSRLGITVTDQKAGSVVSVDSLDVSESHWVAVYDERDGQPGWILGASRVRAGDTSTQVELLRPTVTGSRYYAAILSDDGSDTFDRQTDLPPLSPDKVVIVGFAAL